MDTRTRLLEAAADLLAESPVADISTRAICEAAGVGAPALYRHFGSKEGLFAAVVDYGFEQYLSVKRAAKPSADPVQDLRNGWDIHVAFAISHPNNYRLMYSPAGGTPPEAAGEAHRMLLATLERCAAEGQLRVSPTVAAQMIMSANTGVALMLVSRPDSYDFDVSIRIRDAIHAAVLTPQSKLLSKNTSEISTIAASLGAMLRKNPSSVLSPAETTMLTEWLNRLSDERSAE